MADECAMLPLPGGGHVSPGNLISGQELGKGLGIEAVGLLDALGDLTIFALQFS